VRAQALLDGAPGVNFTSRADGVAYRANMAGGKVNGETAVTDFQAFESIIGPIPASGKRMVISPGQAAELERSLGLPTGRIKQDGGVLSVINDVGSRAPRSPVSGNDLFAGGGRGLPGGGPEINIAPINTAGGGGIRQIILKVK
jgi:filamentous hemagglutinin